MKKISFWARDHKWSARIIIVVLHVVVTACGLVTGLLLDDGALPPVMLPLCLTLFFLAFLFYPYQWQRRLWGSARHYWRRKQCDLALVIASFGLITYLANQDTPVFSYLNFQSTPVQASAFPVKDSVVKPYQNLREFAASMKNEKGEVLKWKERKKLLKAQIKGIREADDMEEGERVALIILSVVLAMLALFGIFVLACNLSCAGSEAAALIVGIGGTALVIWLLVITIRSINRKKRRAPGT